MASCKDAADYIGQFKQLCTNIGNINLILQLPTAYQIFLFHTGLGKEHQDYFTHYSQTHDSVKGEKQVAYSLEYATTRFLQTVRNPTSTRDENTYAFAAQRRSEAYAVPADIVILPPQPDVVPGPNARTIQKLISWCTRCQKAYHTITNCNGLNGSRN